jgi:hypothetical protein
MNRLPSARSQNIVIQELQAELLIYDLRTHKAFNLNETSAIVYKACNGRTSFDELKRKYQFTDDLIFLALDELNKENLLEEGEAYYSPFTGMSRREVIRKVGLATMIALPLISSLVAPTAAMAQSTCVNPGGIPSGSPAGYIQCTTNDCVAELAALCCSGIAGGSIGCFAVGQVLFCQATCQ